MQEGKKDNMSSETFYYSELFKKISNQQKILLNKGMTELGTTYLQSLVILRIRAVKDQFGEDREVSQKDLEEYLWLRASTVTGILARMEENGFIVRKKSAKDSRANQIDTTEKGEAFVTPFFSVLEGVENRMTKGMSEAEKHQLKNLLQRVAENMEEDKI